jgi:SAM-dependent methyltransferase
MAGARVVGVDVSAESLNRARERAELNDTNGRTAFFHVPAEDLAVAFGPGAFDAAFGYAAVHHVDVPTLASNLARVLRADGVAAFPFEPVAFSRRYDRLRKGWLPKMLFPVGCETQDEVIVYGDELDALGKYFEVTITPFHLTTQLTQLVKPTERWVRILERMLSLGPTSENGYQELFWRLAALDRAVLDRVPRARFLCRCATIVQRSPAVEPH